jgi:hypothetical protein
MLDRKELLTGLAGALIGATCTYLATAALYTASKTAENNAFNEALARAQVKLESLTENATTAKTQAGMIEGFFKETTEQASNISETRTQVEQDRTAVRNIRESFASARVDEIARALAAETVFREQLASSVARQQKPPIKITAFKAILHSQKHTAEAALAYAGSGNWKTFQLNPGGSNYLHETKFGNRVLATWWVAERGTNGNGWGKVLPMADGNQVRITGSAGEDAGAFEAQIFVVYEE